MSDHERRLFSLLVKVMFCLYSGARRARPQREAAPTVLGALGVLRC
jgi:hypothetical protein